MGVLNVTPDSFADGKGTFTLRSVLLKARKIIETGADLIDVGGESTRPYAVPVPEEEELKRVIPVLTQLKKISSIPISIDTRKPKVAEAALQMGVSLLNDITGLSDPDMRKIAKNFGVDVCVMHMQGTPDTMQNNPNYPEGVVPHLLHFFEDRLNTLVKSGIKTSKIIIDPGIGFGKSVADNIDILNQLHLFKRFGCRLLIGLSRKSFLSKILNKPPRDLLPATLAMNTMALLAGADIIRVHDVAEHRDIAHLIAAVKERK